MPERPFNVSALHPAATASLRSHVQSIKCIKAAFVLFPKPNASPMPQAIAMIMLPKGHL